MLLFLRVITLSINALQVSVSIIYLQKTEIFDFLMLSAGKKCSKSVPVNEILTKGTF